MSPRSGVIDSLNTRARQREFSGDRDEAEDLYLRALEADDLRAVANLARLRENAGDRDGATFLYRKAADSGNVEALTSPARTMAGEAWPESELLR